MKVAIISPYATVVPHFETELDIAQQHLDRGDQVQFFHCLGSLNNCDFNVNRDADRCRQCIGRREMGLSLLTPSVPCQVITDQQDIDIRLDFKTVNDLTDYKIDNFDIGWAALSSIVSLCRDPEPDLAAYRETLNRFLISAVQMYQQTIDFLSNQSIDRVYIFNGRFAAMRAVVRACERVQVDCYLHERGCDGDHYELFKNHLPHDLVEIEKAILRRWESAAADTDRQTIASRWFQDRVDRVEKVWHSFVKQQESGRLPSEWDPNKKNISIFCSSDDEFVAIGDSWRNGLYPNQVEAIAKIANDLIQIQPETQLYLRVHPNLTQVDNQRKREMMALDFPNLTVIAPDAKIDSYELMRSSHSVVSFGSSVGAEAVYWGKPSVLLGPCFYQNLGGVYRPTAHNQTISLLTDDLVPQSGEGVLKYGYWLQTRGQPHQYFKSSGLFEGKFKGETLYARPEKPHSTMAKIHREAGRFVSKLISAKRAE